MTTAAELRKKYLNFFEEKGHKIIPSASLIPENDPTVLFTPAGMHPLVPYLLGEPHPSGNRLCNVQKCIRTIDIDEVGDASHLTFFEMLGNWSLGDYFKDESIAWSYEFLTSEKWLAIDPKRIAISVFEGDENAPRDEVSAQLWEECGIAKERIFYLPAENNWWIAGTAGPCGPDTEIFYISDDDPCSDDCSPACDCGKYLEIWNNVFMQYNKTADRKYLPLEKKNVDTGMGLDRTIAVLQGKSSVYETDLFAPIIAKIEELSNKKYNKDEEITYAMRIVADHCRTAVFILGDERGVTPSNLDQGYILRRVVRRAVRYGRSLELPAQFTWQIAKIVLEIYGEVYPELIDNKTRIHDELNKEEAKFAKTLGRGLRELDKLTNTMQQGDTIDGKAAFRLYDTFGFPIEITCELAKERNLKVDVDGFNNAFTAHQKISSQGADQKFKGGLADSGEQTAKLHTATHLLLAALRAKFGDDVNQRGSNITAERARFDFNFDRKVTREECDDLEVWVNNAIKADAPITMEEMSVDEARSSGAVGIFTSKYQDVVKVYTAGEFSKEICGGPHAKSTGELGTFKIKKEQSSSAGVRRIRATLS
ncbi:MAG: alanine--tRNA ligase [Clostridiales bacterium]|nr:alanine--tRNA ligase [Clostridiales bacterium]